MASHPSMRLVHRRFAGAVALATAAVLLVACSEDETLPPPPPVPAVSASEAPAPASGSVGAAQDQSQASADAYGFATGPAVLVERGYEHPKDRVDSTGAYLPVNGKPTVVLVDAIWCPTCALTRPIFHRIRHEYQDDINLVVLDFDLADDADLARSLGAWAHPAWAVIAPDSDEVLERRFGPLNEPNLRAFLDGVRATHAGS